MSKDIFSISVTCSKMGAYRWPRKDGRCFSRLCITFWRPPFTSFFLSLISAETVIRILKLLSFLCGMAQVEICYRTLRNAYPG